MRNIYHLVLILASTAILSACGGGGGDTTPEDPSSVMPTEVGPIDFGPGTSGPNDFGPSDSGPTDSVPIDSGPVIIPPPTDSAPIATANAAAIASGAVSQNQIDSMEQLGFTINDGDQPPFIEGSFIYDPAILLASNRLDEGINVGDTVNSVLLTFANQNDTASSVDLVFTETADEGDLTALFRSVNSFVTGNGSLFTAYFSVVSADNTDDTPTSTIALSGSMTDNGIINLQEAFFDFDDGSGNPGDTIPGRVFIDADGFSERSGLVDPLPQPMGNLQALIGMVTFESVFFGGSGTVFTDVVTFGPESLMVDDSGDELLSAISDLGDSHTCSFFPAAEQFLCTLQFSIGGLQISLFNGFTDAGIANGVFEFCVPGLVPDESCAPEDLTDRLLNDPDGGVTVTVTDTVVASAGNSSVLADLDSSARIDADALLASDPNVVRSTTVNDQAFIDVMEAVSNSLR